MDYQDFKNQVAPLQPLSQSLGFLVNGLAKMMRSALELRLKELELTPTAWTALMQLSEGQELNQTDLARKIYLDSATITRTLDVLETKGYIERHQAAGDRRTHIVKITKSGYEMAHRCSQFGQEVNDEFTSVLSPSARQQMEQSILKAATNHHQELSNGVD